jgi:hypothetical protein
VGCGGVGCVGGSGVRSTFHRLHLLRLWTPTILNVFLIVFLIVFYIAFLIVF